MTFVSSGKIGGDENPEKEKVKETNTVATAAAKTDKDNKAQDVIVEEDVLPTGDFILSKFNP